MAQSESLGDRLTGVLRPVVAVIAVVLDHLVDGLTRLSRLIERATETVGSLLAPIRSTVVDPIRVTVLAPLGTRLDPVRQPFVGPNTIGNSWSFWVGFTGLVAVTALYPVLTGPFAAAQFALYFAYALLGLSLAVVWGYGGILSFGQVAFYGVAGYSFGVISINFASPLGVTGGIVASVVIAAIAAAALGYFMFYGDVSEVYVTIITLVTTMVLLTVMQQTAGDGWTIGDAALGGFNGMPNIPDLQVGIGETAVSFTGSWFFWAALGVVVATYLLARIVVNSSFGRVAVAIREDPERTEMFGYDVKRVKLLLFTFGGALAGLGGVMYTTWGSYITPDVFSLTFATLPVVWVSIGGRKSLLGAIVGAVLIGVGTDWIGNVLTGSVAFVLVGSLLVVTILVFPRGAIPGLADVLPRLPEILSTGLTRVSAVVQRSPTILRDRFGIAQSATDGGREVTDR